jgi:hypothetical protein
MLTREYAKTLDEPVPALRHKTPDALARSIACRAKVANWLKYIENNAAKSGVNGPHAAVPALPRLALSSVPSTLCPHVEQRDAGLGVPR